MNHTFASTRRRLGLGAIAVAAALAVAPFAASAQAAYPSKPINLIVPFS
ncbi:MAG: tripartite tricarboxylate transporter substrate binding protein, partial [Variovorax sp.]